MKMITGESGRMVLCRPRGTRRTTELALAIVSAVLLSSCQTSEVLSSADVDPTSAVTGGDVSRSDLDQGKLQFMNGNYGLAEKHFREAVELRRDNAEALMGLAACYDRLGRFDLADKTYSQLLKVAGRQPRIVNNMGYSHYLRGEKAKARTLLLEARAALPGDNTIEANLALLDRS
ncbi:tetratricopeptide repeat protein [Sinorhizobium medicae]|uniref:tetratricopeptide repeat protein n=1 Tax=Sinorhizobium medicae TaxID=110321 RepID=UPI0011A15B4B|nr:tetratricopeptide repeat protein [Sinorhizobium medicae]MBO1945288.1 tetratricopeptide repeat protein [Sinorhizobium medicae]MDX0485527.1 tetratricopeptide repeat protein [Sinorhizobium medicae]MDX0499670.1 tetratricopeptide repeat protein [Sinorhizobium medicae]MDX0509084.1 tetratricopeptide repeat protein [Sinorhizobium medicae]MDX0528448.1 tetratricopeptide repeat protein [Sinorhizobium medicae]